MTREPFKISKAAYFPEHLSMATSERRTSMHICLRAFFPLCISLLLILRLYSFENRRVQGGQKRHGGPALDNGRRHERVRK